MSDYAAVVDMGGTNVRIGRFDLESNEISSIESRSSAFPELAVDDLGEDELASTIAGSISRVLHDGGLAKPAAIGVAFAGPVDAQSRILSAPTILFDRVTKPLPIGEHFQRIWPRSQVAILNDVSAAGYRHVFEHGHTDFCIITVSSGIGNKVFLAGEPVVGPSGKGGEIGHLRVDFSSAAPLCDCGFPGHLGSISSGRGTLAIAASICARADNSRSALPRNSELTNEALAAAFRAGDPLAHEIIDEAARPLGHAMASIHMSLGIERFIIMGGFAAACGEEYCDVLARNAQAACAGALESDWSEMIELDGDDHSGLIGAGYFLKKRIGRA